MRFIDGNDWFSGTKGFYREAPKDDGGGGDGDDGGKKEGEEGEEEEKEFDPATITPAMQKYLDKQKADTEAAITTKIKADLLAEQKATQEKANRDAAKKKATADKDEAALREIEKQEIADAKAAIEADKATVATQLMEAKKLGLVAKYNLPAGYEKRILGATETEWEADAKQLSKDLPKHVVADSEGGNKGTKTTPQQQKESAQKVVTTIAGMF